MIIRWALLLLLSLLSFAVGIDVDVDVKELSMLEKDKYLACSELVSIINERDRLKVDSLLKQEAYLKNGLIQMINLDMMIKCVNNIDDELVRMMYVNMDRIVKIEGVREEMIAFMNVNYNDYKDLNEFIYQQHHREMLKISLELRKEQKERLRLKREELAKKKEEEKQNGNKASLDTKENSPENTEL